MIMYFHVWLRVCLHMDICESNMTICGMYGIIHVSMHLKNGRIYGDIRYHTRKYMSYVKAYMTIWVYKKF